MLITKTPLRISLIGGGTDTKEFYTKHPGAVVSFAINHYIYVMINKKFDGKFRVSYSKTENVDTIDDIQHNLVREALRLNNIRTGLEIVTVSDIPGNGTGLGSSSALTVGLVNAFSQDVPPAVLAERAFVVENEKCGNPTGKQDAYASAFGGVNYMQFGKRSVEVSPIHASEAWQKDFESHSLLLWTGLARDGNEILRTQSRNFSSGGNMEIGKQVAQLASYLCIAISDSENMVHIGGLIAEAWKVKKFFANGISNSRIDEWHDTAISCGAYGGKLCGAGGGGFLFLLAPPDSHAKIVEQTGLRRVNFKIEPKGSEVIYDG